MEFHARQDADAAMRAGRGYSLVEMLTVISIAAILLSAGVPSYRYVTNSNRVAAEANSLLADMEFAKTEAIKEGQPVSLCPSTNGATCASGSSAWQSGWIVFSDPQGIGSVVTGDTIVRVQKAFASATDTFTADNNTRAVTFNREGFTTNLPVTPSGYITVTLHTQPLNAQWTRCLQITTLGMLAVERTQQGACR